MYSYEPHYFEDFEEGQTFETVGRTITQAMVDQYAMVSGDWAEHHTNREYAEGTRYDGRIAHGFLVFSVGTGFLYQTGAFTRTLEAVTEVTVRFPNPVYVGDTVSGDFTVVEKRTGAPLDGVGTVEVKGKMATQDRDLVCVIDADFLVKRRDEE